MGHLAARGVGWFTWLTLGGRKLKYEDRQAQRLHNCTLKIPGFLIRKAVLHFAVYVNKMVLTLEGSRF